MRTKSTHPITADQVDSVFDDAEILNLAKVGKLPSTADFRRFADGIRGAARIYARDAPEPTQNEVHTEIANLHRAAERRDYAQLALLLESLSSTAILILGLRPHFRLPTPEAVRDTLRQVEACETVRRMTSTGEHWEEGRMRPSGNRSITFKTELQAPEKSPRFLKRQAERTFVMWLGIGWTEATGHRPAAKANNDNPGPFARMVQECLNLIGAKHASAVELINNPDPPLAWAKSCGAKETLLLLAEEGLERTRNDKEAFSFLFRTDGARSYIWCPWAAVMDKDWDGDLSLLKDQLSPERLKELDEDPGAELTERELDLWRRAECWRIASIAPDSVWLAWIVPVSDPNSSAEGVALFGSPPTKIQQLSTYSLVLRKWKATSDVRACEELAGKVQAELERLRPASYRVCVCTRLAANAIELINHPEPPPA
jgi:hypothetical protein